MKERETEFFLRREKICWFLIFVIASLVYFSGVNRPLRDAESKYAEIPREMIATGDLVTPHLDFVNYFLKPPLTFWFTAAAYKVFGVHPWVARSTNIFWAFMAAFLAGLLARELFGLGTGFLTSAFFLSTVEVFTYCLDAGIEFGLISCITASLFSFWLYCQEGRKLYLRLFYLFLGLCFLAKGLLGLALPVSIAGFFFILTGRIKKTLQLLDPIGITLVALCIVPWCIIMSIRHPGYLKYFVVNEHLGELLGTRDSKDAIFPTKFFLALITGEFFPWTLYIPINILVVKKKLNEGGKEKEKALFLLIWFIIPLVLFSVSRSKVDFYGLHTYVPLIILLAVAFRDVLSGNSRISNKFWSVPWLVVFVLAALSLAVLAFNGNSKWVSSLGIPSMKIAMVFLIASIIASITVFYLFYKKKPGSALIIISLLMVFTFYCTEKMFISDFPNDSMKFAADIYNRVSSQSGLLFSDERPEFSHIAILPFYTKKPAYFLRNPKNSILHFALKDRMAMCYDEKDFVNLIRNGKEIYLVGKTKKTRRRFKRLGIRYEILGKSGKRGLFQILGIAS